MRRMIRLICTCVSVVLFSALNISALDMSILSAPSQENNFYWTYIVNRLEVGTRITHFVLLDEKRGQPFEGSFFGSITQIKEDQDYSPAKLYVQYRITPQFGVGLAYDKFGFDAGDWGIEGPNTGGCDGKATLSGPLVYLLGRYPNETRFTPFCELGVAIYSASFNESDSWGASGRRSVELDGGTGYYLGVGCDMQINEQFLIDLYGRYMSISDVSGEWFVLGNKSGDVILTPSYMAIGIGAKFLF